MRKDYVRIDPELLTKVNTLAEAVVMVHLAQIAMLDGTIYYIALTTADRRDLLEELGMGQSTFTRALSGLLKAGILTGGDGRYHIANSNQLRPA